MKIWKTVIQQREGAFLTVIDDMIAYLRENKNLSYIITELF